MPSSGFFGGRSKTHLFHGTGARIRPGKAIKLSRGWKTNETNKVTSSHISSQRVGDNRAKVHASPAAPIAHQFAIRNHKEAGTYHKDSYVYKIKPTKHQGWHEGPWAHEQVTHRSGVVPSHVLHYRAKVTPDDLHLSQLHSSAHRGRTIQRTKGRTGRSRIAFDNLPKHTSGQQRAGAFRHTTPAFHASRRMHGH